MDYNAKLREARLLIDKGMYTQAVTTLGKLLESLYADLYAHILENVPLQQRQSLTAKEQSFAAKGDRAAQEKGFAGFPLGGKTKFFRDHNLIAEAERVLNRPLLRFKAFDPTLLRDIRNDATHEHDTESDEDEAQLYFSNVRLLLVETGLIQKAEAKPEAETPAALRSWKENGVIPHEDILGGNLEMSTYAARLTGVVNDDPLTPIVYRDPAQFMAQTYLTRSLTALLRDVLKVLGGSPGDRVLQLRTPFGGGKTHTLIALYHITRNRAAIRQQTADLPEIGSCRTAAIQCEDFPPRKGRMTPDGIHVRTLWGEIAYQLGGAAAYEYVRDDDEHMTAPGGDTLAALMRDLGTPCLILLDEVLNHVEAAQTVTIGDSTLGRQLMIFLKNLTEAVSASKHAALVYSLQASIREGLGAENLLSTLDHLVSRVDAKREPVSGGEIMKVVQRRLFTALGDEAAARQTAAAYAEAFRRARQAVGGLSADELHQIAQDAEKLSERILDSYPFHPDLLDLMYHRWGTLPSYQRTRGALQFLASVVYDLWEHGRDLQPLIGVGDVPLEGENTRNAFYTQIGEREAYTSVIDADFVSIKAGTAKVDRRIASDSPNLQRYRVGTRLATAVLLYSFGAREGEERGVTEPDLIQAAALPGLDRLPLTSALNDLRNDLLYLHYTGRRYRFETEPNLNKLIADEHVESAEVLRRIKSTLERALNGIPGVVLWPEDSARVNDDVSLLQTVYLPLNWVEVTDQAAIEEELVNWIEYCGTTRRSYKNGLAFALPNYMTSDSLRAAARELLAIESLLRNRTRKWSTEQSAELNARKNGCEDRLTRGMLGLYDRVVIPVATPTQNRAYSLRFIDLQSRSDSTLHARVMGMLKDDARLIFDTVTPDKLLALMNLPEAQVIEVGKVVEAFFSHFSFPHLTSASAIRSAIVRGVSDGKFGYTAAIRFENGSMIAPPRELTYFNRTLQPDEIELDGGYLLEAQLAHQLTHVEPTIDAPTPTDAPVAPPSPSVSTPGFAAPPPSPAGTRKRFSLTAQVDKAKWFKLTRAINNLADRSQRFVMRVELTAESDIEYDRVWLRNAVEEPIDEADIDAQTSLE